MLLKELIEKLVILGLRKPEYLNVDIFVEGAVISSDLVMKYSAKTESEEEFLVLCEK